MIQASDLRRRCWSAWYVYSLIALLPIGAAMGYAVLPVLLGAPVRSSDDMEGLLVLAGWAAGGVALIWALVGACHLSLLRAREITHARAWAAVLDRSRTLVFPGEDECESFFRDLPALPRCSWNMQGIRSNTVTRQVDAHASDGEVKRLTYVLFANLHKLSLPGAYFACATVDNVSNGFFIWRRNTEVQLWTRFRVRTVGTVMEITYWSGHMCRFHEWRDAFGKRMRSDDDIMVKLVKAPLRASLGWSIFVVNIPFQYLELLAQLRRLRQDLVRDCSVLAGESAVWSWIEANRHRMHTTPNDGLLRELHAVQLEIEDAVKRALTMVKPARSGGGAAAAIITQPGQLPEPGSGRGPTLE